MEFVKSFSNPTWPLKKNTSFAFAAFARRFVYTTEAVLAGFLEKKSRFNKTKSVILNESKMLPEFISSIVLHAMRSWKK